MICRHVTGRGSNQPTPQAGCGHTGMLVGERGGGATVYGRDATLPCTLWQGAINIVVLRIFRQRRRA